MLDRIEDMLYKEYLLAKNTIVNPVLGKFRFSDGHIEEVRTEGRYNLLMKVPDVHLVTDEKR